MDSGEWQALIGAIALGLNALGLAFLTVQVRLARQQARTAQEQLQQERVRSARQAALDFSVQTLPVRNELRSTLPDDYDQRAIAAKIKACIERGDEEAARTIVRYLGYMENFALAVSMGVYDLEVADGLSGSRLIAIRKNYQEFITYRQQLDDKRTFCRELEWLTDKLIDFRAGRRAYDENGYIPFALRSSLSTTPRVLGSRLDGPGTRGRG